MVIFFYIIAGNLEEEEDSVLDYEFEEMEENKEEIDLV